MNPIRLLSIVTAFLITPAIAAEEHHVRCMPLATAKKAVSDSHGVWVGLTTDQLQFLRGVSSMHPNTPVGIPFGNAAAMATHGHDGNAIVFFLDGKRACDMMPIPDVMRKMVLDIGSGVVKHEGEGL